MADADNRENETWREKMMRMHQYGGYGQHSWRMNFGQRGWIRPTVLRVLEQGPKNGIEIMDSIRELSHGWWRPSPGSIYPLLEQLTKEGLIKKNKEGKYELSSSYKENFGPVTDADEAMASIEGNVAYLEELSQSNKKDFVRYKDRLSKITQRLSKLK